MVDTIIKLNKGIVESVITLETGKHDIELCPCVVCSIVRKENDQKEI